MDIIEAITTELQGKKFIATHVFKDGRHIDTNVREIQADSSILDLLVDLIVQHDLSKSCGIRTDSEEVYKTALPIVGLHAHFLPCNEFERLYKLFDPATREFEAIQSLFLVTKETEHLTRWERFWLWVSSKF
ncbi:hypothetical protein [Laceyella sacchari]|uniref:Uncharacterized protein n=1 Tax=Laceyella sacchari TaxID=37482 RepID=A0ABY5U185_LACSH|nr:hypothetical protein [Laceyella sacchari]UWE03416.1 hypothetical protein NYR52_15125 [Laceyella sacchari]